jgi:hypothetical protein
MRSIHWQMGMLTVSLILGGCSSAPKQETAAPETVPMRQSGDSGSSSGMAIGHDSGAPATPAGSAPAMGSAGKSLEWTAPASWTTGPEKPMRAATYFAPAAGGDKDNGECAIFLNIGGGVQANIDRWIGQFSQPDGSQSASKARQRKETINGYQVTLVELNGTYNAGGMGMGGPSTPKTGYRLLGAIVESPAGEVFFKMTGPEKTINAAAKDFQGLLKSIR